LGLDPDQMLRQAGLDPRQPYEPERAIPARVAAKLLEDSALQSGCAAFGLLLAETRTFETIGAVGLLAKQLPTARDIFAAIIDYQALIADALLVRLDEADGESLFALDLMVDTPAIQGTDLAMAFLYRAARSLTAGRWAPTMVHFAHQAPEMLAVHRRIFDCALAFGSPFNGFSMPSSALDEVNPGADRIMAVHARRYLDGLIAAESGRGNLTGRVRRALHRLLPEGRGTLDQVSAALFLSPRGLQRALEAEGESFARVLTAVRRERALRYVDDANHSMTAIASLTGYASLSAFTRWFGGEFGVPPAAWRAGVRPAPDQVRPAP
jgi:AraC-like DNA-binding protein